MIRQVYDLVRTLATKHRLVNGFKYEMLSKSAGIGDDPTPLVFLEMPLYFGNANVQSGTIPCTFNIDIVLNPQALENYDVEQLNGESCQEIASQIALQFIARMRNMYLNEETDVNVQDYSILTLQRWYDDASYGVRLTVYASVMSEVNFCMDDDYFDDEKELTKESLLNVIDTDDAEGCVSLEYKLPKINLD